MCQRLGGTFWAEEERVIRGLSEKEKGNPFPFRCSWTGLVSQKQQIPKEKKSHTPHDTLTHTLTQYIPFHIIHIWTKKKKKKKGAGENLSLFHFLLLSLLAAEPGVFFLLHFFFLVLFLSSSSFSSYFLFAFPSLSLSLLKFPFSLSLSLSICLSVLSYLRYAAGHFSFEKSTATSIISTLRGLL